MPTLLITLSFSRFHAKFAKSEDEGDEKARDEEERAEGEEKKNILEVSVLDPYRFV